MTKTKIKFPNVHKGLEKHVEFNLEDYIFMKNNHAIIFGFDFTLMVNVGEFFKLNRDPEVEVDKPLEDKLDILEFLNDKLISSDYWQELVNAEEMILKEKHNCIIIDNKGSSKELHYVDIDDEFLPKDLDSLLSSIKEYAMKPKEPISDTLNIPFGFMSTLKGIFGGLITNDKIIFELFGHDKKIRFRFEKNYFIYGIIDNDYDLNSEMFISQDMEDFVRNLVGDSSANDKVHYRVKPEKEEDTKKTNNQTLFPDNLEENTEEEVIDLTDDVKQMNVDSEEIKDDKSFKEAFESNQEGKEEFI